MAPSSKNLQLTKFAGAGEDSGDLEDVRLLDSYEDGDSFNKIEEGMRKVQVRVTGMTCAACSNSVESALNSVNGVVRASVALLQNRADVAFDPNLVKVCRLAFQFSCCLCNYWCV
jgi:Cu+-exporting ATPase